MARPRKIDRAEAAALRASGLSLDGIAIVLKVSKSSIQRIFRPRYRETVRQENIRARKLAAEKRSAGLLSILPYIGGEELSKDKTHELLRQHYVSGS